MWLRQEEELITSKPLFSSQRCGSLTSVYLGCHPPLAHPDLSTVPMYRGSWGLKRSAKPIMEEGMRKGKRNKIRLFWHVWIGS